MIEALVLGGTNNSFQVEDSAGIIRLCSIKGKVLKESEGYYNPLAPGDLVQIEPDALDDSRGQLLALIERKNRFVRFNQKSNEPQILASNLDVLVCVTTPDEPPFRPRFIDRALIQADAERITPLIVLNKSDLPTDEDIEDRLADWERLGYEVMRVSAQTGEGIENLRSRLSGKTSALVGQSGVGKSSILNVLDARLALRTQALSEKFGRGTHTTTRGMLYHLGSDAAGIRTALIDTPGVRRFVLNGISAKDLALYFREMEDLVGKCSYGLSCSHVHESGCKILEAVYSGVIHEQRYESWQRIKEEIEGGSRSD